MPIFEQATSAITSATSTASNAVFNFAGGINFEAIRSVFTPIFARGFTPTFVGSIARCNRHTVQPLARRQNKNFLRR